MLISEITKITLRDVICSWGHDGTMDLAPFDSPKNVELERGQPTFLTGDNGTGKTSFLKSVLGVVPDIKGSVVLQVPSGDEQTCALANFAALRIPAVYVPQKPSEMFARATLVRTVISVWAKIGRRDSSDRGIIGFAESLGIDALLLQILDARVETLSGGQAHVLSLFLAALRNPTLILIDEPTAAISTQRRQVVTELIGKLVNLTPEGNFVLIATHDSQLIGDSNRSVVYPLLLNSFTRLSRPGGPRMASAAFLLT